MSRQDKATPRELDKRIRHREKREQQKKRERSRSRRRGGLKTAWLLLAAGVIVGGGLIGAFSLRQPGLSPTVSRQGIHRHIELRISILGQPQSIPANIGLSPREQPIHTHEEDNVIHLEFGGLVRQDDIRLGRFFDIWGRTFNRTCILDACNGAQGVVRMFVNGQLNLEFEDYLMQDLDRVEITFE